MKKSRKRNVSIILILTFMLCLLAISYAAAESNQAGTLNEYVPVNVNVSPNDFTGTNLHTRESGASNSSWIYCNNAISYLTWQSQWKDTSTNTRYNGFDTPGNIISGIENKYYRYPYYTKTSDFLIKIFNSSNSTISLSATWHP